MSISAQPTLNPQLVTGLRAGCKAMLPSSVHQPQKRCFCVLTTSLKALQGAWHCPGPWLELPGTEVMPGGADSPILTVAGGSCPCRCHAVVADEALALVADVEEVTVLSQAPGTDLTAATTIQDQGRPTGAAEWHPGAVARSAAQLGTHLWRQSHC